MHRSDAGQKTIPGVHVLSLFNPQACKQCTMPHCNFFIHSAQQLTISRVVLFLSKLTLRLVPNIQTALYH